MIQRRTVRPVRDNSGVRIVRCIHRNKKVRKPGNLGDVCKASIRKVRSTPNNKWVKGTRVSGVVSRTVKSIGRRGGIHIVANDNGRVLRSKKGSPLANRVYGVVPRSLRSKGYGKVVSRAEYVV